MKVNAVVAAVIAVVRENRQLAVLGATQFGLWPAFLLTRDRHPDSVPLQLVFFVVAFALLVLVVKTAVSDGPARFAVVLLMVVVLLVLNQAAWADWSYGTTANYNHALNHLDAIYFALGTLTTCRGKTLE